MKSLRNLYEKGGAQYQAIHNWYTDTTVSKCYGEFSPHHPGLSRWIMFCAFLKFSQDIKAYTLKVPVTLQDTTTTRMMAVSTFWDAILIQIWIAFRWGRVVQWRPAWVTLWVEQWVRLWVCFRWRWKKFSLGSLQPRQTESVWVWQRSRENRSEK